MPPAAIRALTDPGKCIQNDPETSVGPKQLCYPDTPRPPGLTEKEDKYYSERAEKLSQVGIPVWDVPRLFKKALMVAVTKCEGEFARELLKNGLSTEQLSLGWADAVVFTKKLSGEPVKEPAILFNADPGRASGGIVVVLPAYSWCDDKKRAVADLKEVAKQWTRLQQLADAKPDDKDVLTRAFDDPVSIFKIIELPDGCPDIVAIAKSSLVKSPVEQARAKKNELMARVVDPKATDYVSRGMNTMLENQRAMMNAQKTDLERKGFKMAYNGLSLNGKSIPQKDLMGEGTYMGPSKKLEKLAKDNGVTYIDIMSASMMQFNASQAYLLEYRKDHPLDSQSQYMFDPSDSDKVVVVGLPPGCSWDESANYAVCGNMGTGMATGMMGTGMGFPGMGYGIGGAAPSGDGTQ